jgi:hypothetical protein
MKSASSLIAAVSGRLIISQAIEPMAHCSLELGVCRAVFQDVSGHFPHHHSIGDQLVAPPVTAHVTKTLIKVISK